MKQTVRVISLVLACVLLLSTLGCAQAPAETTPSTTAPQQTTPSTTAPEETVPPTTAPEDPEETEPTEAPQEPAITPEELYQQAAEDPIITARRDAAEAYMRNMATFLWRAEENIVYSQNGYETTEEELVGYTGTVIRYRAGQLYRGVPYTNSRSPGVNFFDYASEPDANGIHSVSGLKGRALAGKENGFARVGNDCCSSIQQAWNYIGADLKAVFTTSMKEASGYLPVGIFKRDDAAPTTGHVCIENGEQVMYASYAALKKADAVVKYNDYIGHAMMAVDVVTVFMDNGTIDPNKSYVTFLHQTNAYIKNGKYVYDEELGERVYLTYGIDDVFTFKTLYESGYLPVTCDVLIDPEAGFDDYVIDSEKEHTFDNILKGTFTTKWMLSNVTITITDKNGEVVTAAMRYALSQRRTKNYTFQLEERFAGKSDGVNWGDLNLNDLAPGTYHCTHVLRNAHGVEYTMRDFDFTIS